jgi:hypothetical protein
MLHFVYVYLIHVPDLFGKLFRPLFTFLLFLRVFFFLITFSISLKFFVILFALTTLGEG